MLAQVFLSRLFVTFLEAFNASLCGINLKLPVSRISTRKKEKNIFHSTSGNLDYFLIKIS